MLSKSAKILTISAAIVAVFTAWFLLDAKKEQKITGNLENLPAIFKEEKGEKTEFIRRESPVSAQTQKYENSQLGFSFNYPDGFVASEFPEDEGRISLIIQNAKTEQAVQIYITTYDDPDFTVSAEQIKRDIPDLPVSNFADVVVGGKAKGVAFFSENEAFGGPTAEVWFADREKFFQATAYGKDAKLLEEIIKSWKFTKN